MFQIVPNLPRKIQSHDSMFRGEGIDVSRAIDGFRAIIRRRIFSGFSLVASASLATVMNIGTLWNSFQSRSNFPMSFMVDADEVA